MRVEGGPRTSRLRAVGLLAAASVVTASVGRQVALGPCWCESVDAGALPITAQVPIGPGELVCIEGETTTNLVGSDFEDMYRIRICDPDVFRATTDPTFGGAASFDTQLWLFQPTTFPMALGRLGNDDIGPASTHARLLRMPTDGSPAITAPGIYFIAISGKRRIPVSAGGPIFSFAGPFEISGADGAGGSLAVSGWATTEGEPDTGTYRIIFRGSAYASSPPADCNDNGVIDTCDIALGTSEDMDRDGIPDECQCVEDLDKSGEVDFGDMLKIFTAWGECKECPEDLNGDGTVNFGDALRVLMAWGPC